MCHHQKVKQVDIINTPNTNTKVLKLVDNYMSNQNKDIKKDNKIKIH